MTAGFDPFLAEATTTDADEDLDQVLGVDLGDVALYATERPERIWRTMRAAGQPLHMTGERDHWAVTRYDQIRDTFQQGESLSSEHGMRLGEKPTDGAAGTAAGGTSILVTDDPRHAEMRRILEPSFSSAAIGRFADSTTALARELVAEATSQPSVDWVGDVATPLLAKVTCELVGVDESDRAYLAEVCQTAFSGSGYATASAQKSAHVELLAYCAELLAWKKRHPDDDAASALANARIDGEPLPLAAAVMNCHDLILGGNASARNALTLLPATLLTQRPFWEELRRGALDLGAATREILRCENPVSHVMRTAVADLDIGGVRIRQGEMVTLWLRSGNRDESAFHDPETMRLDLPRRASLSFGGGAHYCIAARLATLEMESLVRALADLVDDAELTGPPVRLEANFLRGYRSVPISLHRSDGSLATPTR